MSVPVVAARRSPFCAADGVLAGWHPVDLAAVVMREAIAAADLGDDEVDLVVAGCAEPVGAQGANVAQACVLAAGWRSAIPSLVVDAAAVSGFASLAAAADAVAHSLFETADGPELDPVRGFGLEEEDVAEVLTETKELLQAILRLYA